MDVYCRLLPIVITCYTKKTSTALTYKLSEACRHGQSICLALCNVALRTQNLKHTLHNLQHPSFTPTPRFTTDHNLSSHTHIQPNKWQIHVQQSCHLLPRVVLHYYQVQRSSTRSPKFCASGMQCTLCRTCPQATQHRMWCNDTMAIPNTTNTVGSQVLNPACYTRPQGRQHHVP